MTAFLTYHPLANLFPLIEGDEFALLVEDVRANGVREPIVLLDGQILDGRNRYRAGLEAGFFTPSEEGSPIPTPQYMFDHFGSVHPGCEPLAWVISKNLARRHLTDDQRRMVAARIATLKRGQSEVNAANGGISRDAAAELLSVDKSGVERARTVVTKGAEELQSAVDQRRITVRMAADLAALPEEQQREIVSLADPKAIKDAVRDVRQNLRAAVGTASAPMADKGPQLYETPEVATKTLLALESFTDLIWEPACGRGAIMRVVEAAGYDVRISDLHDRGVVTADGICQDVGDFLLSQRLGGGAPDIVTNPPYADLANKFAAHALREHKPRKMALLLNSLFMFGFDDPDRRFVMDENPPSRVYLFTRRLPMMHRDGWEGNEATSRMNTCWYVWERNADGSYGQGAPQMIRVDWEYWSNQPALEPDDGHRDFSDIAFRIATDEEDLTRETPFKPLEQRVDEDFARALVWVAEQDSFDAYGLRRHLDRRPETTMGLIDRFLSLDLIEPCDGSFRISDAGALALRATAGVLVGLQALRGVAAMEGGAA